MTSFWSWRARCPWKRQTPLKAAAEWIKSIIVPEWDLMKHHFVSRDSRLILRQKWSGKWSKQAPGNLIQSRYIVVIWQCPLAFLKNAWHASVLFLLRCTKRKMWASERWHTDTQSHRQTDRHDSGSLSGSRVPVGYPSIHWEYTACR